MNGRDQAGAHGGLGVRRAGSRNRGMFIWSAVPTLDTSVPAQASRPLKHGQHRQVYLRVPSTSNLISASVRVGMYLLGRGAATDDDSGDDAAAATAAPHAGVSVHALAVRCRTC
jgi:hypothetical protein